MSTQFVKVRRGNVETQMSEYAWNLLPEAADGTRAGWALLGNIVANPPQGPGNQSSAPSLTGKSFIPDVVKQMRDKKATGKVSDREVTAKVKEAKTVGDIADKTAATTEQASDENTADANTAEAQTTQEVKTASPVLLPAKAKAQPAAKKPVQRNQPPK